MALLVGCQNDDEYEAPDTLSDVAWYTSIFPGLPFSVSAEKDVISFLDASQGALSHEWTIEEGNYFLKTGFKTNDDLQSFIDKDLGLSTTNKTAHVVFMKEGISKVCLKNTFSEQVTIQTEDGPISAVQDGDVWVFEKCFEVDVFAKDIKPAFKVYQDDEEILSIGPDTEINNDQSTWPIVDVEVNKTLKFVDLSEVGRPNDRIWRFSGVPQTSTESTTEVAFLNFGTVTNVGSIRSSRIAPLPTAFTLMQIPLKVRVVSSSEPFEILSEISENDAEKLMFQVSGVVDPSTLVGENVNFTVNVVNETSGFNKDINVQSVSVNSDDATFLELTMAEPLYNSDNVTISYNGGNIKSTDNRTLNAFNDKKATLNGGQDLLASDERYSFEIEQDRGAGGNTAGWWTNHNNPWYFTGTKEITAADGSRSVKFHADDFSTVPNVTWFWGLSASETAALVPNSGTYRLSIQVYKESGSTINAFVINTNPEWIISVVDISEAESNKWITYEVDIELTGELERLNIGVRQQDNSGVVGSQTFYIDNIKLAPIEARP